jgi:hypothetical protein
MYGEVEVQPYTILTMGLLFTRTIASGPCQISHSGVRDQNSDNILLSHLRLPKPGGPGPSIYIPQEQGGPGHWVPFPSPLTTSRAMVEVFYPATTRVS